MGTYVLKDAQGNAIYIQAKDRETAERYAYVRGLCFCGKL